MVMTSRTAVRTNRSQVNGTIVLMMAKPLAVKTAQRIWHINVNGHYTIKDSERFWNIDGIECKEESIGFNCFVVFFNFKTFTGGHACLLDNRQFRLLFPFQHSVTDDSLRGI